MNKFKLTLNIIGHSLFIDGIKLAMSYSTNETRIRSLIDEKPLYRKIIQFTIPLLIDETQNSDIEIIIDDLKTIYSLTGYTLDYNNKIVYLNGNNNDLYISSYCNHLFFHIEKLYQIRTVVAIIEYTKTTE